MNINLIGPYHYEATHDFYSVPEDSTFSKMLSCLPIIGSFFNEERAVMQRLEYVNSAPHAVELLDVKNHFKGTSIVRDIAYIAILATTIAVNILSGAFSFAAVGALGSLALAYVAAIGVESYGIYKNNQLKQEIQNTGIRPAMRVW